MSCILYTKPRDLQAALDAIAADTWTPHPDETTPCSATWLDSDPHDAVFKLRQRGIAGILVTTVDVEDGVNPSSCLCAWDPVADVYIEVYGIGGDSQTPPGPLVEVMRDGTIHVEDLEQARAYLRIVTILAEGR